ncbi:MAG: DMT family transporter [Melioribacteraceae bacterium]|nr:DMT family transporter [Melioribacteraceae bacterium]
MWLFFALLNPISEGLRSLFIKRASKNIDPILISWANNVIPVLIFPPMLLLIELKFNINFWIGFLGSGIIQVINTVLYMRAISKGDISTVMPMLSFTPLVLVVASPFTIGELPSAVGFIGILLVVLGSYILNIDLKKMSIFEPFKAIVKNKGTRYMLIVAFLWGISGVFDKISIKSSSVLQHITFLNLLVFVSITILVITQKKFNKEKIKATKCDLFLVSLFTTGSYLFHYIALSLTLVSYVVSIKRISSVFAVLLGYYFLNEPNVRQRLFGSIIMFLGVIFIIFSQ